ncbi:MAG: complex I subunit 5 family protein [Butyrivibrio sp.]|nr:complex I subunit 5 family protein [Butyrivibrio sp.]
MRIAIPDICGLGISFYFGGFRLVFAVISTYMWIMTGLFSIEYMAHALKKKRYMFFLILTYISTTFVFLSDDLYTTFIFFEIMSVSSYVCVIHDEKSQTLRAGAVYLAVAVIGGLVSLMGIFLLYDLIGSLSFESMRELCMEVWNRGEKAEIIQLYAAGLCILFGFGAKAGMFPLHIWLPMAHPVAPAPASALLSGIITKTGIFGILLLSVYVLPLSNDWGVFICILGTITMLLGGILAIISIDIKRTLACSSMSQLGMIITGAGLITLLGDENALAVRGTVLHMVNHSNLKLVLFMAAGVIVMNLHKLDLNEIKGYGRKKPVLKYVFLAGALGIGGIPLFNGYVSKTLLHEAIAEYAVHDGLFRVIEWLFLLTGGMTVCYMTKLFVCVFIEENNDKQLQNKYDRQNKYISPLTGIVLALSALVLPVFGIFSDLSLNRIADYSQGFLYGAELEHTIKYFSFTNLKGGFISIVIGAVLYIFLVRNVFIRKDSEGRGEYINLWPYKLDLLTLIYEPLLLVILPAVFGFICRIIDFSTDGIILLLRKTSHRQLKEKPDIPSGFHFAWSMGRLLNRLSYIKNKLSGKKKKQKDYVFVIAEKQIAIRQSGRIVSASSAFSFMMFAIGIIAVVLYLLIA